jgi:hypothetical protein
LKARCTPQCSFKNFSVVNGGTRSANCNLDSFTAIRSDNYQFPPKLHPKINSSWGVVEYLHVSRAWGETYQIIQNSNGMNQLDARGWLWWLWLRVTLFSHCWIGSKAAEMRLHRLAPWLQLCRKDCYLLLFLGA